MKRNVAIGSVVVFAILVGVYTLVWFHEAGQFKERVEQYIVKLNILALKEGQQYITGLDFLTYSELEPCGFPFSIELMFTDMRLKSLIANPQVSGIVLSKSVFTDTVTVHYESLSLSAEEDVVLDPKLKQEVVKILDDATSAQKSELESFNLLIHALREHFKAMPKE